MILRSKKSGRSTKYRHNSYAKIDWSKASALFQRPLAIQPKSSHFPSAATLLHLLGQAGAKGLTFLFESGKVSVVEATRGEMSYSAWATRKKLSELAERKYLSIVENSDGSSIITITKYGMVKALTYELDTMKLLPPKSWDKKWRLVIFDVPEKYKQLRDLFRMRLKQVGLYQLQKSVYVSPYPCFDEIEFLREIYGVAFTVRYILAERIEEDAFLKHHFRLN